MKHQGFSRREFLRFAALLGGGLAAAGCQPLASPPATVSAVEEAAPSGSFEVVVWYQSWPSSDAIFQRVQPIFETSHPNIKLNIQGLNYDDLRNKFLPSIAAGTEGDLNMLYTNWVISTDVTKVLLDITDAVGGWATIGEKMWPAAFGAIVMPANRVYYLPWLAGVNGAAITVVIDHLKEAGLDYLSFKTYDDVVEAGKKLTKRDADGKLIRSGWSVDSRKDAILLSWIWQLGGEFLDAESGKWSLQTDEARTAMQLLYDVYWTHKTYEFDVWGGEFDAQQTGQVSMCTQGAWTAGVMTDSNKIPSDNIVFPPLTDAKEYVLYPDHFACWGFSRRLANDQAKLKGALDLASLLTGAEGLVDLFDVYSGVALTKAVYEDPRIEEMKYGLMSKRVAEGIWPIARYPKTYIANLYLIGDAMTRALRQEITIDAALAEMEQLLQTEEDAARQRIEG